MAVGAFTSEGVLLCTLASYRERPRIVPEMVLPMAFQIGLQLTAVPEPDGDKRHDDRELAADSASSLTVRAA
jgi:hypothetical protein